MYDLRNVALGLWVDMPARLVLTPEFFAWFAEELKFDFLPIMIDGADRRVNFYWSARQLERALKLADPYAIEIGLTTWPYPDRAQLDEMKRQMDELLRVGPFSEWESDQEFNWRKSEVKGFKSVGSRSAFDLAGDHLVKVKQELCAKHEVRNTMTTFTYHVENGPMADTAQHMDRLMVQAYAINERDGKEVCFDHRFGPGRMQRVTLDRTMQIPGIDDGQPEVGVGHAAWRQTFEGHEPKEAMRVSFESSLRYRPVAHCWWGAKNVYPKSPKYKPYSWEFLSTLRAA